MWSRKEFCFWITNLKLVRFFSSLEIKLHLIYVYVGIFQSTCGWDRLGPDKYLFGEIIHAIEL